MNKPICRDVACNVLPHMTFLFLRATPHFHSFIRTLHATSLQHPHEMIDNQDKKHRKSPRLKNYDYAQNGAYFVTLCTADRLNLFGGIRGGKMELSDNGKIAEECWMQTSAHFPNMTLGEFVIMPNHVHGIIEILTDGRDVACNAKTDGKNVLCRDVAYNVQTDGKNVLCRDVACNVQTDGKNVLCRDVACNVQTDGKNVLCRDVACNVQAMSKISPKAGTLSAMIRSYKSAVTKRIREKGDVYKIWQGRFHDHIIRDESDYIRIAEYIQNNPARWDEDCFNPANGNVQLNGAFRRDVACNVQMNGEMSRRDVACNVQTNEKCNVQMNGNGEVLYEDVACNVPTRGGK